MENLPKNNRHDSMEDLPPDFDIDEELLSTLQEIEAQDNILVETRGALKALKEEIKTLDIDIEKIKKEQEGGYESRVDKPDQSSGNAQHHQQHMAKDGTPMDPPSTTILASTISVSAKPLVPRATPPPALSVVVDVQQQLQQQQQQPSMPVGILGGNVGGTSSSTVGGGAGGLMMHSSSTLTDFVSTQESQWQETEGGFTSNMFVSTHGTTVGSTSASGTTPVGGLDEASGVNMNIEELPEQGGGNMPQLLNVFTSPNTTPKGDNRAAPRRLPMGPPSSQPISPSARTRSGSSAGANETLLEKKLQRKREALAEMRTLTGMKASAKVYKARCQAKAEDLKQIKAENQQLKLQQQQKDSQQDENPPQILGSGSLQAGGNLPVPDNDGLLILSANLPPSAPGSSPRLDHSARVAGGGPITFFTSSEESAALIGDVHLCGSPIQALRSSNRPALRLTEATLTAVQSQLSSSSISSSPQQQEVSSRRSNNNSSSGNNRVALWCRGIQEELDKEGSFAAIPEEEEHGV